MRTILFLLIFSLVSASCQPEPSTKVLTGLDRVVEFKQLFENKRIGIIANHTAFNSNGQFILNVFQEQIPGAKIAALFGPEHGFRGNYSAGKKSMNTLFSIQFLFTAFTAKT